MLINRLNMRENMPDIKYVEENGNKYKIDSDGEKYRISFSEELQLKNLKEVREHKHWLKMNFYVMALLTAMILIVALIIIFIFYRLDQINFFTGVLYR